MLLGFLKAEEAFFAGVLNVLALLSEHCEQRVQSYTMQKNIDSGVLCFLFWQVYQ